MEYIAFVGTNNVGKTQIMLAVAKVLQAAGHTVKLFDSTVLQGIRSYFNFNNEDEIPPQNFIKEDLDITMGRPNGDTESDYILFEAEQYDPLLEECNKIFLLCSCDKRTMFDTLTIFGAIKDKSKIHCIFNQLLVGKNYRDYIYNRLLANLPSSEALIKNYDIVIPFDPEDIVISSAAKLDGRFKLKYYSQDFKDGIYQIAQYITEFDQREFKKIAGRV